MRNLSHCIIINTVDERHQEIDSLLVEHDRCLCKTEDWWPPSHWYIWNREIWAYLDYRHCCCCCSYCSCCWYRCFCGSGGGGWRLLENRYDCSTVIFTRCWRRDCMASCWPSSETPSDYSTLAITVVCLMLVLSFYS
jgi:hypothetical protein